MIPNISLVYFLICGVLCCLMPLVTAIYMLKLRYAEKSPLAVGAVMFLVFVVAGKHFFDKLFLGMTGLGGNLITYTLVSAVTAVLFECGARLVGFHVFMPKNHETERENAIVYGVGHGGLDILIAVGVNMLAYFVFSLIFNRRPELLQGGPNGVQWEEIRQFLYSFTPVKVVWFTVEAAARFTLQIAISVMIFAYVQKKRLRYFAAGAGFQMAASVVLSLSSGSLSLAVTELLLAALAIGASLYARTLYFEKL